MAFVYFYKKKQTERVGVERTRRDLSHFLMLKSFSYFANLGANSCVTCFLTVQHATSVRPVTLHIFEQAIHVIKSTHSSWGASSTDRIKKTSTAVCEE